MTWFNWNLFSSHSLVLYPGASSSKQVVYRFYTNLRYNDITIKGTGKKNIFGIKTADKLPAKKLFEKLNAMSRTSQHMNHQGTSTMCQVMNALIEFTCTPL